MACELGAVVVGPLEKYIHADNLVSPAESKIHLQADDRWAGDFFSIGLSELVFWPIELGFGQGTAGRAVVTYGMDDIAKSVLLAKADGTPWALESNKIEENPAPVLPKAINKVNPETGAFIQ